MWLLQLRAQQVVAIIALLSLLIAATFILFNRRLSVSIQERPWSKHALGYILSGQLGQTRDQSTKSFGRNSPDPIVAQFSAWLTDECGAWGLDSFFISEFEHADHKVRGVGVARNFTAGETTVCVPHKCWFHIRNEPQRILDLTHGLSCSTDHVTALWLAEEVQKGSDSFWAPYIAMLPAEDDFKQFHPAYLEGFKPPTDIDAWQLWNYDMQACYSEYQGRLHQRMEPGVISLGDAKLSFVRLFSRHYDMVGMVPLADLPNTGRQHNVQQTYLDFKSGTLCLNASRNLRVSEEVLVNYGAEQLNPLFMFLIFGFALDPHDHLPMSHGMCVGLRLGELVEPPRDANPVHINFVRFAQRYCSDFDVQEDRGTHLSYDDDHHDVIDHPLSDRFSWLRLVAKLCRRHGVFSGCRKILWNGLGFWTESPQSPPLPSGILCVLLQTHLPAISMQSCALEIAFSQ